MVAIAAALPWLAEAAPTIGATILSALGSIIGSKMGEGKPADEAKLRELNDYVEREAIKRNMSKGISMDAARKQVHDEMANEYAKASGEEPSVVKQTIGTILGGAAGMYGGAKLGKMAGTAIATKASSVAGAKQVADAAKAGVKVGDTTNIKGMGAKTDISNMGAKTDIPSSDIRGMGQATDISGMGDQSRIEYLLGYGKTNPAILEAQAARASSRTPPSVQIENAVENTGRGMPNFSSVSDEEMGNLGKLLGYDAPDVIPPQRGMTARQRPSMPIDVEAERIMEMPLDQPRLTGERSFQMQGSPYEVIPQGYQQTKGLPFDEVDYIDRIMREAQSRNPFSIRS